MYFKALFEKYAEWKIISFFLDNPSSEFYVKELSRELEVSPGTVSIFMRNIEKDKLFLKKQVGNVHLYRLNENNRLVFELKKIHELNRKIEKKDKEKIVNNKKNTKKKRVKK